MSEIYLKVYMEDPDTLVLEGQGTEDKVGYYPTKWDDKAKRLGTVVCGAQHVLISEDAKKAVRRIIQEAHHTGDDLSCLDLHRCYPRTADGKADIAAGLTELCISYLGDIVTKWSVEGVIHDPDFFIGCGEGAPDLSLLNEMGELI